MISETINIIRHRILKMIIAMIIFIGSVVGGARKVGDEPSWGEGRYNVGVIVLLHYNQFIT